VLFCLIPLFSAVIGEANANTAEKIYILSKPVKKGNFLIVKILSTITIALIFLILLISMFVGVTIWLHFKTDSINVFKDHINPYAFFANLIIFSLFGSFLGTLLHYQIKNGITTLIALALSGAFVAVFMMLYPLSTTNSDLEYEHAY
jgi:ABC-type multidrug transport system permease subunit